MISEVDIKDMKELFQLDKGTMFKLANDEAQVPPESNAYNPMSTFKLVNIDGMYSYCLDEDKVVHHFAAWTKVIPCE